MEPTSGQKKLPVVILCLSALGLLLSCVALWEHVLYTHGLAQGPSFCNISAAFNCEAVNASKWSVAFGLPIASYGVFFFLCGVLSALYTGPKGVFSYVGFAGLSFISGAIATLGSVTLFLISEFVIGSICLICVGMYATSIAVVVTSVVLGKDASLFGRIRICIREIGQLCGALVGGELPQERSRIDHVIYAVCVAGTALLTVMSPDVALSFAPAKKTVITDKNPLELWMSSPHFEIGVDPTKGSFGDYVKGPLDAPITIVEFADFECPACRRLYQTLKPFLQRFEGQYRLVFKNYPLDKACNPGINREFHRFACVSARAARCAGEQGRFWDAVDFLFMYEGLESELAAPEFKERLISDLSDGVAIDRIGLKECIESNRYDKIILGEIEEGNKIQLQGTPTLMINGRKAPYRPIEGLEAIFAKILGR